jgi:site-specific DNA recombinase
MNESSRKLHRCAVYTRKSTEHNLDLAFSSLDAQREACAAYVKSQAGAGWRLLPPHYDDGAFSGASLQRPALQALMADIRARKVDIVVVYKVDRLTRSLADFAKLIELFDDHAVSFVAVTQQFNTTTSMGRLTLNILLSFAQFEREVIGERVRDKIAASKRKGIWVGGPVPLGYAAVDKKIIIVPAEAEAVRTIFARYLELGSVRTLSEDLARRGVRSKTRKLSNGRITGGGSFGVGALAHLLKNRFYIGEVAYQGQIHCGDHAPILPRDLFEAVQKRLSDQAVKRRCHARGEPSLLTGRIFDEQGHRLSPSHTNKNGVRYRYYVSHAVLRNKPDPAKSNGSATRVPAADIEALVMTGLRNHLLESGMADAESPLIDRELVERHLDRVTLAAKHIKLDLRRTPGDTSPAGWDETNGSLAPPALAVVTLPWSAPVPATPKGVIHIPRHNTPMPPSRRDALLMAIASARQWVDDLSHGRVTTFAAIARRERKTERHVRLLVPLAVLSPRLISAIIEGTVVVDRTVTALARALPSSWAEQEQRLLPAILAHPHQPAH